MATTTRAALAGLAKGVKKAFPDVKTVYTQPSGNGGYHPSWTDAKAGDYSKQATFDKPDGDPGYTDRGACCAADIMCRGERLYGIASRLDVAMRNRDPRLFRHGKPIVREYFGQKSKSSNPKRGYSLYRRGEVPTPDSHDNHVHLSIHRWAAADVEAMRQLLGVITGPIVVPEPTKPIPTPGDTTVHVPVPVVVAQVIAGGRVDTPFGKPGSWAAGYHTGDDWNDPNQRDNTTIQSAVEGHVLFAGYRDDSYGYTVIVEDAVGDQTRHCHLDKGSLKVSKGDYVTAGQPLGIEGSTGNSTGPHCHVERRQAPYDYDDHEKPMYDAVRPDARIIWASDLVPGASNTSIYWLQLLLNSVSFAGGRNLRLDGHYGLNVADEVKKLQRQHPIGSNAVDGDIGYREILQLDQLSKLPPITIKEK